MASPMFARATPKDLADRSQVFETKGKIADFSRLVEVVERDLRGVDKAATPAGWRQTPVDIRLRFGWVEARPGIPGVEGRVSTTIPAVCQRCLDPFDLELDAGLRLLLTDDDEGIEDSEDYEVWEVDVNDVSPADIVEEALIMALPFAALHPSSDSCGAGTYDGPTDDARKAQPFADLRSIMARDREQD